MRFYVQFHDSSATGRLPHPERSDCLIESYDRVPPAPGDVVFLITGVGTVPNCYLWEAARIATVEEHVAAYRATLDDHVLLIPPRPVDGEIGSVDLPQDRRFPCALLKDQELGAYWLTLLDGLGPPRTRQRDLAEPERPATAPPTHAEAARRISSKPGRPGQDRFRRALLARYKCCPVTGCHVEGALSAAHIFEYYLSKSQDPDNGILLRADIHLLFDRHLLRICHDPPSVVLTTELRRTKYRVLHHRRLRTPPGAAHLPSRVELKRRWDAVNSCPENERVEPPAETTDPVQCDEDLPP